MNMYCTQLRESDKIKSSHLTPASSMINIIIEVKKEEKRLNNPKLNISKNNNNNN